MTRKNSAPYTSNHRKRYLIQNGYNIHLVVDAVSSRTKENHEIGLTAMKSSGARLTSTEMVLFELLCTTADPKAKEIFKIVK